MTAAIVRKQADPFKAAAKYDGPRQGSVFRTGDEGTGYYADVAEAGKAQIHEALFPLASIAPVQLSLQELVPLTRWNGGVRTSACEAVQGHDPEHLRSVYNAAVCICNQRLL